MKHLIQQAGGYENHIVADCNSNMRDGDAKCVLAYLQGKTDMDFSFFFFQYTIDKEIRLANLFWTNSQSRLDFACLRDVFAFNTCKISVYKKPLVIWVRANCH